MRHVIFISLCIIISNISGQIRRKESYFIATAYTRISYRDGKHRDPFDLLKQHIVLYDTLLNVHYRCIYDANTQLFRLNPIRYIHTKHTEVIHCSIEADPTLEEQARLCVLL